MSYGGECAMIEYKNNEKKFSRKNCLAKACPICVLPEWPPLFQLRDGLSLKSFLSKNHIFIIISVVKSNQESLKEVIAS